MLVFWLVVYFERHALFWLVVCFEPHASFWLVVLTSATCLYSDWLNDFQEKLEFSVPNLMYIQGIQSELNQRMGYVTMNPCPSNLPTTVEHNTMVSISYTPCVMYIMIWHNYSVYISSDRRWKLYLCSMHPWHTQQLWRHHHSMTSHGLSVITSDDEENTSLFFNRVSR